MAHDEFWYRCSDDCDDDGPPDNASERCRTGLLQEIRGITSSGSSAITGMATAGWTVLAIRSRRLSTRQIENGRCTRRSICSVRSFEEHPENVGTKFEVLGRRLAALQTTDRQKTDPNFQKIADPKDSKRVFFPEYGPYDWRHRRGKQRDPRVLGCGGKRRSATQRPRLRVPDLRAI